LARNLARCSVDQGTTLGGSYLGYTKTGVIGRPLLGTATKGQAARSSLTRSFADTLTLLTMST
jgi:hypothetical protein